MPLPLILGIGAAIAGAAGIGVGSYGIGMMIGSGMSVKEAKERNERNIRNMEEKQKNCISAMDKLGEKEVDILKSFEKFQNYIEQIRNRPSFKEIQVDNATIPEYNPDAIKSASIGALAVASSLGSAAVGTAGGIAASGAVYAIATTGVASTGAAISGLSGAAATNATLAAIGGGSLAAGGLGVAGGTAILGAATLGIGLLVGGAIMGLTGNKISEQADEATAQVVENEKKINKVVEYLNNLKTLADEYFVSLDRVDKIYQKYLIRLAGTLANKTDWRQFTETEKRNTKILVTSVTVLYHMCKVQLVKQASEQSDSVLNGKSYYITPLCASNNVLDVSGASSNNGTNIQSYKNCKASNQRFITEQASDGYFVLRDEHSGKVLDVDYGIAENGRRIQLWEFNGSPAQLWKLLPAENGHFNICSKINENYCIDIPNATSDSGVAVHLWKRNGTNAQNFEFVMSESDSNHADDTLNTINYSDAKEAQQKADAFTNTIAA